ncbi:hypothetical protein [Actinopolymorpha pittospori]|uniref:Uncharacterized protein n=1 Tax=Actinopolymorpha pittospori TaxID=648752 RepID=A0A927MTV6_9ACTN|nr:hypothetical protein [Actinopolymorpha pittospori]MBE1606217.1 hypothetical protein [Actinopolymorpha pittospori]
MLIDTPRTQDRAEGGPSHRARWVDSPQARALGFLACAIGAWVPILVIAWLVLRWLRG